MPIDYVNGANYFLVCPYGDDSKKEMFEQVSKMLNENSEYIGKKPLVVNLVAYKPFLDWDGLKKFANILLDYKIYKLAQYIPNNEYLAEQCRILDAHLEAGGVPSRTFRTLKDLHYWFSEARQGQ